MLVEQAVHATAQDRRGSSATKGREWPDTAHGSTDADRAQAGRHPSWNLLIDLLFLTAGRIETVDFEEIGSGVAVVVEETSE